jgi:cyclase
MTKLLSWHRVAHAAGAIFLLCTAAACQPAAKQIGQDLYAYISDNDSSANSTFLVGDKGILVVDTGLNAAEASKLLNAIRQVSKLPVKFIVNTHYHPDHQGGNAVVGADAVVISTDFTRQRTLALMKAPEMKDFRFQPAELTFQQKITLYVGPHPAEIFFSGKAHTSGDTLVYFPDQKAIAMGDLFLNRSSPAMDDGSANNWIQILDHVLDLPVTTAVPGHFELGTRADLTRFRDYLRDLYLQVEALKKKGQNVEEVRREIHMEKYSDFRQYPKFEATFSDNAATIYRQLDSRQ